MIWKVFEGLRPSKTSVNAVVVFSTHKYFPRVRMSIVNSRKLKRQNFTKGGSNNLKPRNKQQEIRVTLLGLTIDSEGIIRSKDGIMQVTEKQAIEIEAQLHGRPLNIIEAAEAIQRAKEVGALISNEDLEYFLTGKAHPKSNNPELDNIDW